MPRFAIVNPVRPFNQITGSDRWAVLKPSSPLLSSTGGTPMDYRKRITALQQRMDEQAVDLIYLTRGANLFYLTGVRRHYDHGTDHNAYGDWASGAYIARTGGVILLAPQMGGGFWRAEGEGKPWID